MSSFGISALVTELRGMRRNSVCELSVPGLLDAYPLASAGEFRPSKVGSRRLVDVERADHRLGAAGAAHGGTASKPKQPVLDVWYRDLMVRI